ncbi:pteridine reductase [Litoribrevibacter albus]|uniref:Pteridine reductase n=1 Tax=Litoribrevibacter albus TaxID=1473156 RepID=A0AA37SFB1_9GAMM|nr:pteridine reductase [Litoribrevibacter albus]GLQ33306.1 pteridine reductase [Litoribrevibacter albus]
MKNSDQTAKTTLTVLITGAAQRLGAAMSRAFHSKGFKVIVHYHRSSEAAESLLTELNSIRPESAFPCQGKLSDIDQLVAQISDITDRLDVLINNASAFYPTQIGNTTEEHWNELFESNAKAPLFLTQALLPLLTSEETTSHQPSCVINMLDIHAQRPLKDHTIYCMAKAANQMMTLSLAKDLAPKIRVNGIAPGAILWPDQEGDVSESYKQQTLEKIPAARMGSMEDIVETALFLATGPSYITGEIISVDGGRRLYS